MNNPIRLTAKGERLARRIYTTAVMTAVVGTFLLAMGLMGWIETGGN
jgi:hypothetical protein